MISKDEYSWLIILYARVNENQQLNEALNTKLFKCNKYNNIDFSQSTKVWTDITWDTDRTKWIKYTYLRQIATGMTSIVLDQDTIFAVNMV